MSSQSSGSFFTPYTSPTPTSASTIPGLPATPVVPRKIRRPSAQEAGSSNGLLDVMYRSISPSSTSREHSNGESANAGTSTNEGVHMSASVARAGFLHAAHSMSFSSSTSIPRGVSSHQQSSIRERTMALAQSVGSLHNGSPTPGSVSTSYTQPAYPFPDMTHTSSSQPLDSIQEAPTPRATSPLRSPVSSYGHSHSPGERGRPSALSLMIARARSESTATATHDDTLSTPTIEQPSPTGPPRQLSDIPERTSSPISNERTPLLDPESMLIARASKSHPTASSSLLHKIPSPNVLISSTLQALPSVLLGSLLNILDALSYGMLLFPSSGLFSSPSLSLPTAGVSLFFVSALTSQLVYAAGGSSFAGANGSMMIEVVPFFHILANQIVGAIGEDKEREVIATTLSAYALSSILTGLAFLLLGYLRMGRLVGFFPRHILVGCIGGIGVFLILTGLRVATRLADDDPLLSLSTIEFLFSGDAVARWLPAAVLAVGARVLTSKVQNQLAFPGYMLFIPLAFYAIILLARLNMDSLRESGWIFDAPSSGAWYAVYGHFSLRHTDWSVIGRTMPTQLALLFFNVLHPPLNVPALAVSLGKDDVDVDKELRGHAWSNLLSGVCGSVPNYLVYVNTLLFVRVGGGTKVAGWMLALANVGLLIVGTGIVRWIPVLVVSALIFVLGLDLVKEAVWDCRDRVSRSEYVVIWVIVGVMTGWDFVVGVLVGVVVSCVFFVVQNSRRAAIRAVYSGEQALSTVRRPGAHRAYLRAVGAGTVVMRLQGFLFFGTIAAVEDAVRALVNRGSEGGVAVRFVILDLALVGGVDMSAAEAFVRVQRLCAARGIVLCFSGATSSSDPESNSNLNSDEGGEEGRSQVASAVEGVLGAEVFADVNGAMEWAENVWLREWYDAQKEGAATGAEAIVLPGREASIPSHLADVGATPRRTFVSDVGRRTMGSQVGIEGMGVVSPTRAVAPEYVEALTAVQRALSAYGSSTFDGAYFTPLLARLERLVLPAGTVLFAQGDQPEDGLYILAAGVLRATYAFPHGGMKTRRGAGAGDVVEAMVPGAIAGELSALAGEPRNATVSVDIDAVVWRLGAGAMGELKEKEPGVWEAFVRMVLKSAKVDYDMLLSALAARQ